MWGSRFSRETDAVVARLNASFGFDRRLYRADIRASAAYASALLKAGALTEADHAEIQRGLAQALAEFEAGTFQPAPSDEDIHTAVERRLIELIGAAGGKLHTGRSRNDQVATDARLYVLEAIAQARQGVRELQRALVGQAEAHVDTPMPGYTHLQRAQPITFAHWALAHFWPLQRDAERLADCARRTAVLPLGAGALAGNAFNVDRDFLARELGFRAVSENSVDAVSDRDFIAEFLFAAALIGVHLSRLAEDVILYASAEFGFLELDDAYSTGSSLMPQKKNPDPAELARGKAGRLIGHLAGLLATLKGLPSAYNKDLQEDKEPLFDAVDTLALVLPAMAGLARTWRVNAERMRAALDESMLATDLADYLTRKGMPFREAHAVVGRLARQAAERRVGLSQLAPAEFRAASPLFEADMSAAFDFAQALARRDVPGGTAPDAVRRQLKQARGLLIAD